MESIIKLITRPEFYFYLRLNKIKDELLPRSFTKSGICGMCFSYGNAFPSNSEEKRLKFINKYGPRNNLCYSCNPVCLLTIIYHNNNLEIFNQTLTDLHPKNLNHQMIKLYLSKFHTFDHDKCCNSLSFNGECLKLTHLINNTMPTTYIWDRKWNIHYIELLLEKGNKINTSYCLYDFVVDYTKHSFVEKGEFEYLISIESENKFDEILNLDYLGNASRIMAITNIYDIVKIKVDGKSKLGKLIKLLELPEN